MWTSLKLSTSAVTPPHGVGSLQHAEGEDHPATSHEWSEMFTPAQSFPVHHDLGRPSAILVATIHPPTLLS